MTICETNSLKQRQFFFFDFECQWRPRVFQYSKISTKSKPFVQKPRFKNLVTPKTRVVADFRSGFVGMPARSICGVYSTYMVNDERKKFQKIIFHWDSPLVMNWLIHEKLLWRHQKPNIFYKKSILWSNDVLNKLHCLKSTFSRRFSSPDSGNFPLV